MDTMNYTEKKKSFKGPVIFLTLFLIIGGIIIFLAISSEKDPIIIGQNETDIQRLVDLDSKASEETMSKNKSISFKVSDEKYTNKSNNKIKADMSIPVIVVDNENLEELNKKIHDKYFQSYDAIKLQLKDADHKYTYKVSYNVYDNMVGTKKVISIVVIAKNVDDESNKNVTMKIDTYNIDVATKKELSLSDIAIEVLGKEYKTKIKQSTLSYVVANKMIKEEDYIYAITGLESFYVKDTKFHIIFNEGELVDKKYESLDIEV
ncbi:MAG: hypothetical protein RSB67_04000 [Clostridia bacterium]